MVRCIAAVVLVGLAIAGLPAQGAGVARLPTSSLGQPPVRDDVSVTLEHVAVGGQPCERFARSVCAAASHWQAKVWDPVRKSTVTVPMADREALTAAIAKAAADDAKVQRDNAGLTIRASDSAAAGMVMAVMVASGLAQVARIDIAVVAASGAEQRLPLPLPVDDGAPVLVDGPAKDPSLIRLQCDRATGEVVCRVDRETLAAGREGAAQLHRLLSQKAKRGADGRRPVVLRGDAEVPWQALVAVVDACLAEQCAIEFANPEMAREFDAPPPMPAPVGELRRAFLDGAGPGWRALALADFVNVNGNADTWTEKDGVIHGTGKPNGGARSKQTVTNFEMVFEWKHLEFGGNSGLFVWCPESAFTDLKPGTLPRSGIEVQVLDLGYEEQWLKQKGKRSDWFTSHGDVFPVGGSTMQPFTPQITYQVAGETFTVGDKKDGRCFPIKRLVKPMGEWNHYYVRALNGEIRLWVNGEEVSGGTKCSPATGYLALEAEGAAIEFRNLRIRELP